MSSLGLSVALRAEALCAACVRSTPKNGLRGVSDLGDSLRAFLGDGCADVLAGIPKIAAEGAGFACH
jgi:hypothetical protein